MTRYVGRVQPRWDDSATGIGLWAYDDFEPWREPEFDIDLLDERLRLHAHRGRYPCRYDHWRSDCDSEHCCQAGELAIKSGWTVHTVRRRA